MNDPIDHKTEYARYQAGIANAHDQLSGSPTSHLRPCVENGPHVWCPSQGIFVCSECGQLVKEEPPDAPPPVEINPPDTAVTRALMSAAGMLRIFPYQWSADDIRRLLAKIEVTLSEALIAYTAEHDNRSEDEFHKQTDPPHHEQKCPICGWVVVPGCRCDNPDCAGWTP